MSIEELKQANEKIADNVTGGFKKMSDAVTGGYKKIEKGFVGGYTKIEDGFVDRFLRHEGESIEEAKQRLNSERTEHGHSHRRAAR